MGVGVGPRHPRGPSPASSSCWSLLPRVKLSHSRCMMSVQSLQESPFSVSSSPVASSEACLAKRQGSSGALWVSQYNTERLRAGPSRMGCVGFMCSLLISKASSWRPPELRPHCFSSRRKLPLPGSGSSRLSSSGRGPLLSHWQSVQFLMRNLSSRAGRTLHTVSSSFSIYAW